MAAVEIKGSSQAAKIVATIAKGFICLLPVIPAVRVNLDGATGQGMAWTTFAIASVLAGAMFIEAALECKSARKSALFGLLAVFFVTLNVLNAIGSAASHSDISRDNALSQAAKKKHAEDRRNELSQARKELVAIAGSATPEGFEAEAKALKAKEARLWSASFQCDPQWITKDATKAFCAEVATIEAKHSAAARRDQIDVQLGALDAREVEAPPAAIESYVNNMARFLGTLGYAVDDKAKELIAASRDWLKGIGVELLAAFGPAALLSLLASAGQHKISAPQIAPQTQRKQGKAANMPATTIVASEVPPVVAPEKPADPVIDAFVERRLEPVQDVFIPAKTLYEAWVADCAERGVEPGVQKAFCLRLQKRIMYDRNNNRPRYCHVRLKPAAHAAPLRLAVNNSCAAIPASSALWPPSRAGRR